MPDLKDLKIEELPLVGPSFAKKLEKLQIKTVWDLFHHLPFRFLDFSKSKNIIDLEIGETATIKGTVTSYVNQYTKKGRPMQIVTIADETSKVNAIWFNQIYLSQTFKEGVKVALAGELSFLGRQKAIISPEYETIQENQEQIHTDRLVPIYPETSGVTSKWLRRRIFDAWKKYENSFEEFLPKEILEKYKLINFKDAIKNVHFPQSLNDFEKGKNRLAFNELLALHSQNIQRKKKWEKNRAVKIKTDQEKVDKFVKSLPFELTNSQQKVIAEILSDLQKDVPMNRLLEGDVGSGKTVIAAIAMFAVFLNNKKSVLMAPTQILANQHYETLNKLFAKTKVKIGLVTSTTKNRENADVIVGTHALLHSEVIDENIALIVIDEQHKFGVEQRNTLVKKSGTPHVLTMTATPIPRTIALTFFGDLALSTLDELPKNRQKITTWVIGDEKRNGAFEWIYNKIKKEKVQAFVVCPLIEESESETMAEVKAAKKQYEEIKNKFKDLKVEILHGKLKHIEKDKIMKRFENQEIDILITTPVVEVGIDVANATIMVIETAERFGLASLHQLRGRVGRGNLKSYCLLMTDTDSPNSKVRLEAMTKNLTGFELSEIDLALRGPGEIYGTKQSGIPELKIASWEDLDMIRETREVAMKLLDKI